MSRKDMNKNTKWKKNEQEVIHALIPLVVFFIIILFVVGVGLPLLGIFQGMDLIIKEKFNIQNLIITEIGLLFLNTTYFIILGMYYAAHEFLEDAFAKKREELGKYATKSIVLMLILFAITMFTYQTLPILAGYILMIVSTYVLTSCVYMLTFICRR